MIENGTNRTGIAVAVARRRRSRCIFKMIKIGGPNLRFHLPHNVEIPTPPHGREIQSWRQRVRRGRVHHAWTKRFRCESRTQLLHLCWWEQPRRPYARGTHVCICNAKIALHQFAVSPIIIPLPPKRVRKMAGHPICDAFGIIRNAGPDTRTTLTPKRVLTRFVGPARPRNRYSRHATLRLYMYYRQAIGVQRKRLPKSFSLVQFLFV